MEGSEASIFLTRCMNASSKKQPPLSPYQTSANEAGGLCGVHTLSLGLTTYFAQSIRRSLIDGVSAWSRCLSHSFILEARGKFPCFQ